ncbi:ExbD/TolR family protein [Oryzomicrobium sp.]|uniref:ExbD/TolR family protein n=1 Tax=Oryzomicrobium sp. TaxID=1911578 RepID=UPI002FE04531
MRPRRLKNEINVVPYIDVMLVLLVIFMVTAPMMQTGSIDLPTAAAGNETPQNPVVVSLKADQSIVLKDGYNGPEQSVDKRDIARTVVELQNGNDERPVAVVGDKSVKLELLAEVLGQLKESGVKRVGMDVQVTPTAGKR